MTEKKTVLDKALIRELAELLSETGLSEIEIERNDTRVRVARNIAAPAAPQAPYGPSIIKYLEGKGISWLVWCFDPEWGPTLISNWDYTLNPSGEFAKQAMHGVVQ